MEFKVKKNLTITQLKFVKGETRYVKITGQMHLGKPQKADKEGKTRDPAMLTPCVNLEGGEECQIILSAVVKSVFEDEYPGHGYVGKCFAITKGDRAAGREYFQWDVKELEDPSAEATVASVAQHPASRQGAAHSTGGGGRGR
jgi:hypothetical protein